MDVVERMQKAVNGMYGEEEDAMLAGVQRIMYLEAQLQRIIDHYDMRSEMYTNDADLAANLAAIAREALQQVSQ